MRRFWLFAAAMMLWAGVAEADPAAGGVYVILNANDKSDWTNVAAAAKKDGVDGVLIHLTWNKISDGFMHYDFSALKAAITQVVPTGKRFEIGIVTDGAVPSWVTDPSGLGAASAQFEVNASVASGCQKLTVVPPYDDAYMEAFRDLLAKLSAYLHNQGYYDQLSMLKLSALTTTTDELRLPARDTCPGADPNANLKLWTTLDYTPAKVRSAWDGMLHAYASRFPDKSFNIGFIGLNAFPGIRNNGTFPSDADKQEALSESFLANLISDAGKILPGRVALGFDSLTLNPNDESYGISETEFLADAAQGGLRLGWQTNELFGQGANGGAACDGNSKKTAARCATPADFHAMLFSGIYPNGKGHATPATTAQYLELFEHDILEFPKVVQQADGNLVK
ncbi:MAG TPA: hypothetical protein VGF56_05505 [Rhizomicrobium sp.]